MFVGALNLGECPAVAQQDAGEPNVDAAIRVQLPSVASANALRGQQSTMYQRDPSPAGPETGVTNMLKPRHLHRRVRCRQVLARIPCLRFFGFDVQWLVVVVGRARRRAC